VRQKHQAVEHRLISRSALPAWRGIRDDTGAVDRCYVRASSCRDRYLDMPRLDVVAA
jgi:hypothetical protein